MATTKNAVAKASGKTAVKTAEKPAETAIAAPVPEYHKVKTEGFIDGMPEEIYHGNCCDSESLSSSMARMLVEQCPKKMWGQSYMNPNKPVKENKNFDMGHALHKIFLEPDLFGASVQEIEAPDYRTNDAKAAREAAYQRGKTPLLTEQFKTVFRMRGALMADPIARKAFTKGVAERSYFVKDKETGVWLKARVDWEMFSPRVFNDYKSTMSASPSDFPKSIFNFGYYVQEPFYRHIVKELTGEDISQFYFIAQEKEEPFLVTVNELKPAAIEWGEKIMRKAIRKFADCLDRNEWHGYRDPTRPDVDGVITLDLPSYAYYKLEDRQEQGEFDEAEV